jgi:hypothetical protein
MCEDRVTFTFYNQRDTAVDLVIEPWALVESVAAGEQVVFEVNATPPAEVEFSVTEAGQPFVYVMSERVTIHVDGAASHDFRTAIRPPLIAFRILKRHLWGNDI